MEKGLDIVNIRLQTPFFGKELPIRAGQTVETLKDTIFEEIGIPTEDQRLFIAGKQLEDRCSLLRYNVCDGCVVNVLKYIRGGFVIIVKTFNGYTIQIEAEPSDTVEMIKTKIQEQFSCPSIFQGLVFAGKEMEDKFTLDQYNIQRDSTLHLVLRKVVVMVQVDGGKSPEQNLIVNVNSTDTVSDVKKELKKKVPKCEDCLLYSRTPVEDNKLVLLEDWKTLAECNITKETVFEFTTKPKTTSSDPETTSSSSLIATPSQIQEEAESLVAENRQPISPELQAPVDEFLEAFTATLHQAVTARGSVYTVNGESTEVLSLEKLGIRIYVPKGVVPLGETCKIAVVPVLRGSFEFPHNCKPVSGIYAIGVSHDIQKPITIEVQHCAEILDDKIRSHLTFARAEHGDSIHDSLAPYKFNRCTGGRFAIGSKYGSLDCSTFTLYTALLSLASWLFGTGPSPSVERYKALFLYQKSKATTRKWTVHFIVIKNLNKHLQLVSQKIPDDSIVDRNEVVFSFAEPEIILDIPPNLKTDGWEILPNQHPCKIIREDVDMVSYSDADLPVCSIDILAKGDCSDRLHHSVSLKGVNDPALTVFLNCYLSAEDAATNYLSQSSLTLKKKEDPSDNSEPISSVPSLKELMNLVAMPAVDQFKMIGIGLGFDLPTLNAIEQQHNHMNERFIDLFGKWLNQDPTWEAVFEVLESSSVGRTDLVNSLRKKLTCTDN